MEATTHCKDAIDTALRGHFAATDFAASVEALSAAFQKDHFVEIDSFVPPSMFDTVLAEVEYLFETASRRRDITIPTTGNTWRRYRNLDRDTIANGSETIPAIFQSAALLDLLAAIAGEKLVPVPYVPEEFIASRLSDPGDVHGWHWDDYSYALVWILRASPRALGGSLQYVKDTHWNQSRPEIEHFLDHYPVETRHPATGSAYLLKSATSMHRVTPVSEETERIIVCFSYANTVDLESDIRHDTMELLYPEVTSPFPPKT